MRKTADRRTWTTVRVPPWTLGEVPPGTLEFAEKRVSFLRGRALEHPLRYLLACAYLQGINDCVQAHINNPELGKAP